MYQRKNWIKPIDIEIPNFEEGDQILYNYASHTEVKIPFEFVREYPNYLLFRSVFGGYTIAIDRHTIWKYCEKIEKKYEKSDYFEYFLKEGFLKCP